MGEVLSSQHEESQKKKEAHLYRRMRRFGPFRRRYETGVESLATLCQTNTFLIVLR